MVETTRDSDGDGTTAAPQPPRPATLAALAPMIDYPITADTFKQALGHVFNNQMTLPMAHVQDPELATIDELEAPIRTMLHGIDILLEQHGNLVDAFVIPGAEERGGLRGILGELRTALEARNYGSAVGLYKDYLRNHIAPPRPSKSTVARAMELEREALERPSGEAPAPDELVQGNGE